MTELRSDINDAMKDLEDGMGDIFGPPTTASVPTQAPNPDPAGGVLTGEILPALDNVDGDSFAGDQYDDQDDDRNGSADLARFDDDDDDDGVGRDEISLAHAQGDLTPYESKRQAKREFDRLARDASKLTVNMAIFIARGGPKLLGYSSPVEAVMEIKSVAKSQAYREVGLSKLAGELATAAGFTGTDGVARVLELDYVNAKTSEVLGKKAVLEELKAHLNQSRADNVSPERIVSDVLPDLLENTVRQARGGKRQTAAGQSSAEPVRPTPVDQDTKVECPNCHHRFLPTVLVASED